MPPQGVRNRPSSPETPTPTPTSDVEVWGSVLRLLGSIDTRLSSIEREKSKLVGSAAKAIERIEGLLANRVAEESVEESAEESAEEDDDVEMLVE